MSNLISTFQERFGDWLTALGQHLQLSLLTLIIAIFLSIPLAIYLSTRERASNWVLQLAGVFQTIPSMALLGLFIPIMGIGTLPALTALVIYAIFPILQNTITGLRGLDPSLEEAGIAFGMTKWERLKKFEIPLAMPVVMSGVRTSAVMIIGTATLAALIGAGGLGSFILLGIDRRNYSLILIQYCSKMDGKGQVTHDFCSFRYYGPWFGSKLRTKHDASERERKSSHSW